MKYKKGFTLIELLVTVVIISSLLGIVLLRTGAVGDIIAKANLEAQGREILQELLANRSKSIMDGITRIVFIFEDKIYIQPGIDGSTIKKIEFQESTSITSNTYQGKRLEFRPVGTVNFGGHFTLENDRGHRLSIVVQIATGRIYLREEN